MAERQGWRYALKQLRHIGIQGPGELNANGPDYITYDPATRTVVVWDATIGGKTTVPPKTLVSWLPEVKSAIDSMPAGPEKTAAAKAFKAQRVEGQVYKSNE